MPTFKDVSVEPTCEGEFRINMEYPPGDDGSTPRPEAVHDLTSDDLEMIMWAIMEHRYSLPHRPTMVPDLMVRRMGFPGIPGDRPIEEICAEFAQQELPDDASYYEEQEHKALRLAAEEICDLRTALNISRATVRDLNEKQRGHKAEIVELHHIRRELQDKLNECTVKHGMTQEEREFLWLAEESVETALEVIKGLRFGMDNHHPARVIDNRQAIAKECGHVHAAVTRLLKRPSMDSLIIVNACSDKSNCLIPGIDTRPTLERKD